MRMTSLRAQLLGPLLALTALAASLPACGSKESIVAIGDGKKLSADEIDADPLALLPGGALVIWQADAAALLASSMGPQVLRTAQSLVPLTPEMNFEPRRDLKKLYGAGYSMQSADVAMIAQGDFDPDAIKKAADRGALSAAGKPLQKTSYGGNDLYLTGDVGFVVLTRHSLLVGNPAGLRRALDRLRDARVRREIPDWVEELLKTPGAEIVVGADITGQTVASTVSQQLPFVQSLTKIRALGDFKDPGMNLAGSLSYSAPQTAAAGNDQIRNLSAQASALNLLSFVGISSPLRNLQTSVKDSDVQFIAQIDGPVFAAMLDRFAASLRAGSAAPTPAR
ncbi:MAG: hypothetical protein EOO75_05015 [Myxococcales bacterium]|nr:MAG: hypothetical protein EOO75_05015 [Myxococcales bacterium]